MSDPVARVRDALEHRDRNPRGREDAFMALCPAHDDSSPSLSVGRGSQGQALVNCFAGCATEDVVAALGLCLADLFPDDERRATIDRRTVERTIGPGRDQADENNAFTDANANEREAENAVVVPLEQFVAVDEPGAAALLGTDENALIPEGGDVMIYGDGGVGKTTLAIDFACHLAAGRAWLDIPVPRRARVLLIENEGPRALYRRKLRRKLEAWDGDLDGYIHVFEKPWGKFTFATEEWRTELAQKIAACEIDVLIVGPTTRVGMNDAGTLQDIVTFMGLIADLRERSTRSLTVTQIHHENKAGTVSGAWEGAGDTLLHVQGAGNGHTIVHVQKARWSSEHHQQTLRLAWTEGDSFERETDRDLDAEVEQILAERGWLTVKEICASQDADPPGIGAGEQAVRKILGDADRFVSCTGDDARALRRSPRAVLYALARDCAEAPSAVSAVALFTTPVEGARKPTASTASPLRDAVVDDAPSASHSEIEAGTASHPSAVDAVALSDDDVERAERLVERWGEDVNGGRHD